MQNIKNFLQVMYDACCMRKTKMFPKLFITFLLTAAAAVVVATALTGCMSVHVENLALKDHSSLTVTMPKTITITTNTDAQIPATALGL